jgi:hypothetical protein
MALASHDVLFFFPEWRSQDRAHKLESISEGESEGAAV